MIRNTGITLAGVGGSVLAHIAILSVLWVTMRPDPVVQQQMPQSELDVQSYQLDSAKAAEQEPEAESARSSDATGTAIAAGAVPQSRANPVVTEPEEIAANASVPLDTVTAAPPKPETQKPKDVQPSKLLSETVNPPAAQNLKPDVRPVQAAFLPPSPAAPANAEAEVTPAAAIMAPVVAAAQPRPATVLAEEIPSSVQLATVAAPSAPVLAQAPATASLSSVDVPATPPLIALAVPSDQSLAAAAVPKSAIQASAAAPSSVTLASAAVPSAATLAPAAVSSPPLASAPVQSQPAAVVREQPVHLTAQLAFAGQSDGEVDPVSLAAFQSFVRPGDIQPDEESLRDGVSALLAQVPCSRLQVGFDPDTATLQVNGHVSEDDIRAPVLAALQARMGQDITVSDNMLILPRPQCGALSGIANVGLPQSTDQITNPLLIGEDTHARVLNFVKDDRLFFDLTAPEYDAYIYVDYFDADGNVLHLSPNEQVSLKLFEADHGFRVGAEDEGDTGLQIFIGPPYGQEIAVAFASSAPLYEGLRPIVEPAAPYLNWLKSRVEDARNNDPDFKGEWVYFFVTTAEQ